MPKPVKQEKKAPVGQWIDGRFVQLIKPTTLNKTKNSTSKKKFYTSDGDKVSQSQINSRLSKVYGQTKKPFESKCQCCGIRQAEHHDHTISRRRCKLINKTELIWDFMNWSLSCSDCHSSWEGYKGGAFKNHLNYKSRMDFVKKHDPEGYRLRVNLSI